MSLRVPSDAKAMFGLQLRELRISCGLSQEDLADAAGLDRTYVSSCERGKRNIGLINIHRLAAALGVLPHGLLEIAEQAAAQVLMRGRLQLRTQDEAISGTDGLP